jgi:hypothetical protein
MRRLLFAFLCAVPLFVAAEPFTDICDQQLSPAHAQVHIRIADPRSRSRFLRGRLDRPRASICPA